MTRLLQVSARARRTLARGGRDLVARALPLKSPSDDRPLWVFGGSSGREYCDNSRSLHEYVIERRPDLRAVWLIDRRSPDVGEVEAAGDWVDHSSIAAHRLVRAADVLVFSHGIHDVPGLLSNSSATVVRLGHGLTAFKQTKERLRGDLRRMTARVDLAPVASVFERSHKEAWGFGREKLPITGLARWDSMAHRQAETRGATTVLFALTWRDWIGADLGASSYGMNLRTLANQDWFESLLAPADLQPELFLHPIVREALLPQLSAIPQTPGVVTRGRDVPDALARSALVITDYSSLAWDALYLGIPVIFFHFDLEEYLAHRASFVDLRARLFGPTTRTVTELGSAIQSFVTDGLRLPAFEPDQARWAQTAFAHHDDNNCERIVASIEQFIGR